MIDTRSIQSALKAAGFYKGEIDGNFGNGSRAARDAALRDAGVKIDGWPHSRLMIAINQWVMNGAAIDVGPIDGLAGPSTEHGLEQWQNALRDTTPKASAIKHMPTTFPRQKDMLEFYGEPGTGHTRLTLPYPMRIAWDTADTVEAITIHEKCAASAGRAFEKVLFHYGYDKLRALGLDLFGGCFNNRKMRGGSALSTHAFAAAIDIDPINNQFRWGADRAKLAGPKYAFFIDAFEAEGWVSLGRERNFDWQHFQAARL
jgi:D-alanyl-D-alanine carboxypeptidase